MLALHRTHPNLTTPTPPAFSPIRLGGFRAGNCMSWIAELRLQGGAALSSPEEIEQAWRDMHHPHRCGLPARHGMERHSRAQHSTAQQCVVKPAAAALPATKWPYRSCLLLLHARLG